jgi:hypothetical protein
LEVAFARRSLAGALGGTYDDCHMTWSSILFIVALGGSLVSGSLMRARASRLLTPDQNNQVVTMCALRRVARPFLILYGLALLVILAALGVRVWPFNVYALLVLGLSVAAWSHVTFFRKLRALNLPSAYVASIRNSRTVVYCGLFICLAIIVYEELRSG